MNDDPPDGQRPTVVGFDRTATGVPRLDHWVDVARATLDGEGVADGRLDLIFVDEPEMAELNEAHMGHAGPTDVLSFPLDADLLPDAAPSLALGEPPIERHLGDVVVCPAVAEAQAVDHTGHADAELSLLVIHGVLHVLGHDHAEAAESATMRRRETRHLAALGFDHPEPVR